MTNPDFIDSLRDPEFSRRVWGYDSLQVDAFLAELRERLELDGAGLTAEPPAVSELAGIGEKVDAILDAARDAAEQARGSSAEQALAVKRESEEAAEQLRNEADEYATATRRAADEYEASTRSEAEQEAGALLERASSEAEAKVAAADEEADQMLRDARLELSRIEDTIEDLRERRQMVIASIERLRGSLATMVGEASQGTSEHAALAEETLALDEEIVSAADDEQTAVIDLAGEASSNGGGDREDYDVADDDAEFETGDWETAEEDTEESEESEEDTEESETNGYRYANLRIDTDEQPIRGEDL